MLVNAKSIPGLVLAEISSKMIFHFSSHYWYGGLLPVVVITL